MALTIRPAGISDYASLCDIYAQANREHCAMRPDLYRPVPQPIPRYKYAFGIVARGLGYEPVALLVAEQERQTIGAVFVQSVKRSALSWSAFEKEAYLDNVAVLPDFRRQGVGTALLHRAIEWAKDTGHSYMHGKIIIQNDASLKLFAKLGFNQDSVNVGIHLK